MDLCINQNKKMNIRALVKATLNDSELGQAKNLFVQTQYPAFVQNPEYDTVIGNKALHVLIYNGDFSSMEGYALVETKRKLLATISFGPLCKDENSFSDLVSCCFDALLNYGFKIIRFQPPFIQSDIWKRTLVCLQKKFTSFSLPSQVNWSTLVLDISPSKEILLASFSENHRRSIKKAKNDDLVVEKVKDMLQLNGFAKGLCKMYAARNIAKDLANEKERIKRLFSFVIEKGNGLILEIKKGTQLLGGIVLIKHNNSIFYLLGFSDPDYKNIPVNHLLFFKSFEIVREGGCDYFDFGGYGREGFSDKQVLNINRFKDGFKGKRIDYPDTILIAKNRWYPWVYKNYMKLIRRKK